MKALIIFCLGCTAGWFLELLFRRFISKENRERKWVNPGFLIGPWLPLYGLGLCILYFISDISAGIQANVFIKNAIIILIISLSMTAIEFLAGMIAVKLFKVHLWDYSNERGNIRGMICPRFSIIWACLGAFYYFSLHGKIENLVSLMINSHLCLVFLGFYLGVFSVDTVYSGKLLVRIRNFARDNEIVVKYSKFSSIVSNVAENRRKKRKIFKAITTDLLLNNALKIYLDWIKTNADIVRSVIKDNDKK